MQTVLTVKDISNTSVPDFDQLRVISDSYEDQGNDLAAEALRWLADRRKWPLMEFGLGKKTEFRWHNLETGLAGALDIQSSYELMSLFFVSVSGPADLVQHEETDTGPVIFSTIAGSLGWFIHQFANRYKPASEFTMESLANGITQVVARNWLLRMQTRNLTWDLIEPVIYRLTREGDTRAAEALSWLVTNKKWPMRSQTFRTPHVYEWNTERLLSLNEYDDYFRQAQLPSVFFTDYDEENQTSRMKSTAFRVVCDTPLQAISWFVECYHIFYKPSLGTAS